MQTSNNLPSLNKNDITVGTRVTRGKKLLYSSSYLTGINGTVIEITYNSRCYIKWDVMASNGQWHSTCNPKYLIKV